MIDVYNLSRNLNKIQKIWAEQGPRIALRKLLHITARSLRQSSKKRTLQKRNVVFRNIDEKVLNQEVERFFSYGLWRSPNEIKLDIKSLPSAFTDRMVQEGKRVLKDEFILYGCLKVYLGNEAFSWLRDPFSGFVWPLNVHPTMVGTQKPAGTDVKNIWEIARFQFLSPVAYAYILTGDERYIRFAIEKIKSWLEENPFLQGPHWARAMEASIRLINWCVYLPLLDVFQVSKFSFRKKFTKSILEHLIYIRENLEASPSLAGNHYLADLVGLLLAPLIFPSLTWAKETATFSEKELNREILKQFTESGINFEGSLSYHRLASEICLVGVALIKKLGHRILPAVVDRLRKAAEFTGYVANTCVEFPIIGDNDSGIFLKFFARQEFNQYQYLLFLTDYILEEKSEPSNLEEFLCLVHFKKARLPLSSGRGQWNDDTVSKVRVRNFDGLLLAHHGDEALIFNTLHASGGHTHNDKLSVYPVIGKRLLFIDRGSFSYTGFIEKRHKDRMTASHNGPVINGWEQNPLWKDDVFYMDGTAKCSSSVAQDDDILTITGWHTGYRKHSGGLKVFRKVSWDIRHRIILITDWAEGCITRKNFQYTWVFLINPDWTGVIEGASVIFACAEQTVYFELMAGIKFVLVQASYCPSYQVESPCQALTASYSGGAGKEMNFFLRY